MYIITAGFICWYVLLLAKAPTATGLGVLLSIKIRLQWEKAIARAKQLHFSSIFIMYF